MSAAPEVPGENPAGDAVADAAAATEVTPGAPDAAPPRWDRRRVATAVVAIATPLMLLGLLDPLEGGILIAILGIPVAIAAFGLKSAAKWLVVIGLGLIALMFIFSSVVGDQAAGWQVVVLFAPWLAGVLLVVAGDVVLLHQIVGARNKRAANLLTTAIVLVVIALVVRVAILLGEHLNMP